MDIKKLVLVVYSAASSLYSMNDSRASTQPFASLHNQFNVDQRLEWCYVGMKEEPGYMNVLPDKNDSQRYFIVRQAPGNEQQYIKRNKQLIPITPDMIPKNGTMLWKIPPPTDFNLESFDSLPEEIPFSDPSAFTPTHSDFQGAVYFILLHQPRRHSGNLNQSDSNSANAKELQDLTPDGKAKTSFISFKNVLTGLVLVATSGFILHQICRQLKTKYPEIKCYI